MTSGPSTAAPIPAVLAVVLATLGAYVRGYVWSGEYVTNFQKPPHIYRLYRTEWQVTLFTPVSRVEQAIKGVPVRCVVSD